MYHVLERTKSRAAENQVEPHETQLFCFAHNK